MTRSVQASSSSKPHRTYTNTNTDDTVQCLAKEAAESSRQHRTRFANLAALARTIQAYVPAGKKQQGDYAPLVSALVASAEHYGNLADVHDIAFSLMATDNMQLLNADTRADMLWQIRATPGQARVRGIMTDRH
jgi:hypothetical protein